MKAGLAVIAIIILFSGTVHAQGIHIHENAVISVGAAKKVQDQSTAHKITFYFEWATYNIASPESARVEITKGSCFDTSCSVVSLLGQWYPADDTVSGYGGAITMEFNPPSAGVYTFLPAIFKNNTAQTLTFCSLSYDDSLFMNGTWGLFTADTAAGPINVWYPVYWDRPSMGDNIYFETPYSSGFQLTLSPSPSEIQQVYDSNGVSYGQTALIDLANTYDCTGTAWYPYYPMTLRIVSGGQYASIHTFDSETMQDIKLGSVVNVSSADSIGNVGPYFSGGNFYLVADGVLPDSLAEWVVVEAQSGGLTSIDSIGVFPPPVAVTFGPSEISPGDTANIIVMERNPDGTLADFPPGQQFEVQIDSGQNYGTILSSGDTAGYFASIPQPFQFVAADSINADSVMVSVQVEPAATIACSTTPGGKGSGTKTTVMSAASGVKNKSVITNVKSPPVESVAAAATKGSRKTVSFVQGQYGIGWVEIKKPTLTMVNHAPWSIWPYLPPVHVVLIDSTGAVDSVVTEVYPPDYNYKRGFTISVTDAEGMPVPNAAVAIRHDFQQSSGGHVHGHNGTNSLTPPQKLQGIFYGQGKSDSLLELTTDANGIAIIDSLVASQVSGTYLITAYLVFDPSVKDTVNLNVQVPELAHFGDWIIVPTGETQPWTFYQSDNGNSNHPNNNYCTIAMGDSLALGIFDFYEWSSSDDAGNGGVPITLSLNDMSLPWGGLFDIHDTWQPDHQWHRVGRSVDINNPGRIFQYPDPSDSTRPIMTDLGRQLERYMKLHQGYRVNEGRSVHYEFYNAYLGGY